MTEESMCRKDDKHHTKGCIICLCMEYKRPSASVKVINVDMVCP